MRVCARVCAMDSINTLSIMEKTMQAGAASSNTRNLVDASMKGCHGNLVARGSGMSLENLDNLDTNG